MDKMVYNNGFTCDLIQNEKNILDLIYDDLMYNGFGSKIRYSRNFYVLYDIDETKNDEGYNIISYTLYKTS